MTGETDDRVTEEAIDGRAITDGRGEGEVLRSSEPVSFYGAVDLSTGEFIEEGHELEGHNVAGKVLVFPRGKGSTVGSYVLYGLAKNGVAPAAILNEETETIVATGAILGEIPCMDSLSAPLSSLPEGERVVVDADAERVLVDGCEVE
ncbi:hypothetical protein AArcSl_1772 [Halalkaliarchaeum desulfuricum]|uniref:Phosphomevalonate dehydratase small subunit n=1 Tax=Halalkaliarchaeum desulfuricum TaxID=2055893 RepID=A0A343TJX8_9EURY|nr:DUF126 domain-containing protein [Halalkaliarchaeum desulfuricum]AUX09400.1 hypothetical protein AArcSl_1772 [Halalkaliarchaeum desulfuricum]